MLYGFNLGEIPEKTICYRKKLQYQINFNIKQNYGFVDLIEMKHIGTNSRTKLINGVNDQFEIKLLGNSV